jgi:iron(III) transport system permease protein
VLLLGVGVVVMMLGTGAAWLVTAFQFPGRKILVWALLLPLAVPTYVVAYSYLDLLHPIGPLQSLIRTVLGYSSPREFRLPDTRSMFGAILILGSVLYPYVYLSARHMFLTQPANLIEAARGLGHGPFSLFFRVALPMARPAIVVGTTLALLETLNDVGASEFLGLQTGAEKWRGMLEYGEYTDPDTRGFAFIEGKGINKNGIETKEQLRVRSGLQRGQGYRP